MNTLPGYIVLKNMVFYFQLVIGITGNTLLLVIHISTVIFDHRLRPTNLIISFLAFTHIVLILTTVFMMSPYFFGSHSVWDDFTCKILLFLKMIMRGFSIFITSLLSVLQVITIDPRISWLAKFKHQHSYCILALFVPFLVINVFVSGITTIYTSSISNGTKENILIFTEYCALWPMDYTHLCLMFTMKTLRDGFFIGIMVISSGYTVIFLYRHKKQSQYLHSNSLSTRTSPEAKAIHTILLFSLLFVVINCYEFLATLTWHLFSINDPIMIFSHILIVNGFSSMSSIILISSHKHIVKVLFLLCGKNIPCIMIP